MYTDNYIEKSLELHLFFGRIMKEHALFLKAGFTPVDAAFSEKAALYQREFEKILAQAVKLGEGIVSKKVLCSGELVTEFTALAEKQTESFTGIPINKDITSAQLKLCGSRPGNIRPEMRSTVKRLNQKALELLNGLISFKEQILRRVTNCEMFTLNYPMLIEHIIREARLYRRYVEMLEREGILTDSSMHGIECFWNRIMMEHALFIRGLLDPSESGLIQAADGFAGDYSKLLESCHRSYDRTLTAASLEKTIKFRDFKSAGTKGIEECKIRSVILPLLADHVLREANHFIRLLSTGSKA